MSNGSDTVIATRRYYTEPEGEGDEIVLSFERPVQEESGYFRCVYRFTGAIKRERWAGGADGLDALMSALAMAGTDLDHIDAERYGNKLMWDFGKANNSLPTIEDHWPHAKRGEPGAAGVL